MQRIQTPQLRRYLEEFSVEYIEAIDNLSNGVNEGLDRDQLAERAMELGINPDRIDNIIRTMTEE